MTASSLPVVRFPSGLKVIGQVGLVYPEKVPQQFPRLQIPELDNLTLASTG